MEELKILYRDEDLIAIHKPINLLVHRSPIDKKETRFALQLLRDQIGQYVYPVHRLDKPTSGVLLLGLSQAIAIALQKDFEQRNIEKKYKAIVRGFTPETLEISNPVKSVVDRFDKKSKTQKNREPKPANTVLKTIEQYEIPFEVDKYPVSRYSYVELIPLTGRRHQLRYHMKHISHPIIGDAKYGKSKHNLFFEKQFNVKRLFLCATGLSFIHPQTKARMAIETDLDEDFKKVLNELNAF